MDLNPVPKRIMHIKPLPGEAKALSSLTGLDYVWGALPSVKTLGYFHRSDNSPALEGWAYRLKKK
jgi:hypothetical protein